MRWGLCLALGLLGLLWPTRLEAQVSDIDTPSISLERLWLQPGPGAFLSAQDAQVQEPGAMSLSVLGSLMSRPLVLSDLRTGEEASVPVKVRLGYELALSRGISERLQLGIALPVVAAQDGDRLQGIGLSEASLAPVGFGDIRLHGKVSLQDEQDKPYHYGMAFALTLPTGDEQNFAGEAGPVFGWTMLLSYRTGGFRLAGNLGLRVRSEEVILLSPSRPHGNELIITLAGEYQLPADLELPIGMLAELSQVEGDDGGPSPGEFRLGLIGHILPRARLKLALGRGYTPEEVGAPDWRVAVLLEYEGRKH